MGENTKNLCSGPVSLQKIDCLRNDTILWWRTKLWTQISWVLVYFAIIKIFLVYVSFLIENICYAIHWEAICLRSKYLQHVNSASGHDEIKETRFTFPQLKEKKYNQYICVKYIYKKKSLKKKKPFTQGLPLWISTQQIPRYQWHLAKFLGRDTAPHSLWTIPSTCWFLLQGTWTSAF